MTLATLQEHFIASITAPDDADAPPIDPRLERGMAVYRNAYQTRLVATLLESYPRTARWVGDDSFRTAAAHHLIWHPPTSWTVDLAGHGFVETIAGLFPHDRDVGDLAALEWAMHGAFVAADAAPISMEEFGRSTARYSDDDWSRLTLTVLPSVQLLPITTNCTALWQALARGEFPRFVDTLEVGSACVVWREGHHPVFRVADPEEAGALRDLATGTSFGGICAKLADVQGAEVAASMAGTFLAGWIATGLVDHIKT